MFLTNSVKNKNKLGPVRNQEKGVFRRAFCWSQYPWEFFVSSAVTLDSAETPFAKPPFSLFLNQLIAKKAPKLGLDNNSTAYVYIYGHIDLCMHVYVNLCMHACCCVLVSHIHAAGVDLWTFNSCPKAFISNFLTWVSFIYAEATRLLDALLKGVQRVLGSHATHHSASIPLETKLLHIIFLVTRPNYPPPHHEAGVAIPLFDCVSCGIADYRCYTSTSFCKNGLSQSKDRPNKGGIAEKASLWSPSRYKGVARKSIANRAIVGH